MKVRQVVAAAVAGGGLVLVAPAVPASAGVVATGGASSVTVTMTGTATATFGCSSSKVTVNGVVVSPNVACSALTTVSVTGDGGDQRVQGETLDAAAFVGGPHLVASMGAGQDVVYETAEADTIQTGTGLDGVVLYVTGAANDLVDLASDYDFVYLYGDAGANQVVATATGSTLTTTTTTRGLPNVRTVANAERFSAYGAAGNDTIDASGIIVASTIDTVDLWGQDGDDTLISGPLVSSSNAFHGGTGTNTFDMGTGGGTITTESVTDVIQGDLDGIPELIFDYHNLHSGGRTITGFGFNDDTYQTEATGVDVVARVRDTATPGTAQQVLSLNRSGIQVLPSGVDLFKPRLGFQGDTPHNALVDVVAGTHEVEAEGPSDGTVLLDVTVPTGTWAITSDPGTNKVTVTPAVLTLAPVSLLRTDAYKVHGPWTNKAQGFAHRATRDLLFRFPTDAARDQIRDQLVAGTTTRAAVVTSLMSTDEYRGLDVDRVFQSYLHRKADSGGRNYWIGSLRNGKSLRQFRAQLFGSNEYFNQAGATNADYVVQAYADVLGRTPDPSGKAYWTNKLNNGADRGQVALQFLSSTEARRNIAKEQFLRFLDRYPTTAEADAWVATLGSSSQGEQELIAFLVGSSAYYNRS